MIKPTFTGKDHYLIEGHGKPFVRFSYIADLAGGIHADQRFATATITVDAVADALAAFEGGEVPEGFLDICRITESEPSWGAFCRWLTGSAGKSWAVGQFMRKQQSYADRGTLINQLLDHLVTNGPEPVSFAGEFLEQAMLEWSEAAKLEWEGYIAAKNGGVLPKDAQKPSRGPQCPIDDALPYAESLIRGWHELDGEIKVLQPFLTDTKRYMAGHPDGLGKYMGSPAVFELKTSTDDSMKPNYRAQVGLEVRTFNEMTGTRAIGVLLMVTPEKFFPRIISDQGLKDGIKDAECVLDMLKRKSMRGSFLTARESKPKENK